MAMCEGSYQHGIETKVGKRCLVCGKEFDNDRLAGHAKNIPMHSPIPPEFVEPFDDISYGGTN
jgi:hypothetical protein